MAVYNYAGVGSNVLIGKETAWGTAVTANKNIGLIQSFDMTERNSIERVHALGVRDAQALVPKVFDVTGSTDVTYQVGRLLAYAIGKDTLTGAGDPYTHTIEDATGSVVPSFTAMITHAGTSNVVRTYAGCVINSLRLSGDMNAPLKIGCDLMAKSVSLATTGAGTYTPDTTQVPAPQYGNVKIGAAGSEEAILQVQNFEFTVNNNFELVAALGQRLKQAAVPKTRTFDLRLTASLTVDSGASTQDGYEQLQVLLGGTTPQNTLTEKGLVIAFDNGIGGGAGTRSCTINLNNFLYDETTLNSPVEGIITLDLTGMARIYNASSKIVCLDDQSAAYL